MNFQLKINSRKRKTCAKSAVCVTPQDNDTIIAMLERKATSKKAASLTALDTD